MVRSIVHLGFSLCFDFFVKNLNPISALDWKRPHSPGLNHFLGPLWFRFTASTRPHNSVIPLPQLSDAPNFYFLLSLLNFIASLVVPPAIRPRDVSFPSGQT